MIPLALMAGAAALPSLAQGIYGYVSGRKYAKLLESQKNTLPSGITEAESLFRRNAKSGLAGKDIMEQSINEMMPTYLSQAKRVATGPGALLKALVSGQQEGSSKMLELQLADAEARQKQITQLGQFLGSTKAEAEYKVQEANMERQLDALKTRMQAGSDLMGGITNAVASGMNAYSSGYGNQVNQLSKINEMSWLSAEEKMKLSRDIMGKNWGE